MAVFGAAQLQQVLSDRERFVMPASSSARLALPSRLAQLNRSLHSLQDPQHGQHKRALAHLLGPAAVDEAGAQELLEQAVRDWAVQEPQPLLERMRDLSLCLAAHVLLGADVGPSLPRLMQSYFALRRQAASPANDDATALRRELLASGRALDRALRRHLRSTGSGGVFGRLLDPAATPGIAFDEGEAAGHANILFVSASEPVAVALTWTFRGTR